MERVSEQYIRPATAHVQPHIIQLARPEIQEQPGFHACGPQIFQRVVGIGVGRIRRHVQLHAYYAFYRNVYAALAYGVAFVEEWHHCIHVGVNAFAG